MSVLTGILDIPKGFRGGCGSRGRRFLGTLFKTDTKPAVDVVPQSEEVVELTDLDKAIEDLKTIQPQRTLTLRRMQFYDPKEKLFGFACGDGSNSRFVTNKRTVENMQENLDKYYLKSGRLIPYETKFNWMTAERFLRSDPNEQLVDFQGTLNEIKKLFKKYLYYEDERLYTFMAMWAIGTYCYQVFNYYGYLWLWSSAMRMGKTKSIDVNSHIAYEATEPLLSPSGPAVRNSAEEGRTSQYDTIEGWKGPNLNGGHEYQNVMRILDVGFKQRGTALLMVGGSHGGRWNLEKIPVYSPYAMAGIAKDSLAATAEDRTFPIELHEMPARMTVADYDYYIADKEFAGLRDELYLWALQYSVKIADNYRSNPNLINDFNLNHRGKDIWKPLFCILDTMGLGEGSQEWKDLKGIAQNLHNDTRIQVLQKERKILAIFRDKEAVKATNTQIQNLLEKHEVNMNQYEVTQLMKSWGIVSKKIRPSAGLEPDLSLKKAKDGSTQSVDGYELSADDLERLANDHKQLDLASRIGTTGTTTTTEKEQIN